MLRRFQSSIGSVLAAAVLLAGCTGKSRKPAEQATDKAPPVAAPAQTDPKPKTPTTRPGPGLRAASLAGIQYVELITGGATGSDPSLPLVIAIHGLGDRPESFSGMMRQFPAKARVVLPQGISSWRDGWAWFETRARDGKPDKLASEIREAAAKVDALSAALMEQYPDAGKPVVTGFSQGGMLSFALAVLHPEHVGISVPLGGWLPPSLIPNRAPGDTPLPKVVALHGTADNAVPFGPTKESVDALVAAGFPVELRPYPDVKHVVVAPMRAEMYALLTDALSPKGGAPQ